MPTRAPLCLTLLAACGGAPPPDAGAPLDATADATARDASIPPDAGGPCGVDVHQHLVANRPFDESVLALLATMDEVGIATSLLMPPPFADPDSAATSSHYTYLEPSAEGGSSLLAIVRAHPGRLALVAGGGALNPTVHASAVSGIAPEAADLDAFEAAAERVLDDGAVGFGEMATLHLSIVASHSFISAPADHPYLLRLAELAARRGVPIDVHAEMVDGHTVLVPEDLPINAMGRSCFRNEAMGGNNPAALEDTIAGLERLLAHAPAVIVWSHVGWDNIGDMTAARLDALMRAHPNLHLSLKMLDDPSPGCQLADNRPLDPTTGALRPEWRALLEAHADRVLLGADEFFGGAVAGTSGAPSTRGTWAILERLDPELARRVACENPRRVYGL